VWGRGDGRRRRFLLPLQSGAESDHDVLHLVPPVQQLAIASPDVPAFARRVLGGSLETRHAVGSGEARRLLLAHLAVGGTGVTEVALVTHQEPEGEEEGRRRGGGY